MSRITITRQQLYDQIWSEPTLHVARQYGLSDVGLAKLCKRNSIPKPPRGYLRMTTNKYPEKVNLGGLWLMNPHAPRCHPSTNLADRPSAPSSGMETFGVSLLTGGVEVVAPVAPDQALVYQSSTDPLPIIAVEMDYTGDMLGPTPNQVEVQLSVGGITGDALYYSGTLFSSVSVRFAHQIDADTLATGRYDYEMTVPTYDQAGNILTRTDPLGNVTTYEYDHPWGLKTFKQR